MVFVRGEIGSGVGVEVASLPPGQEGHNLHPMGDDTDEEPDVEDIELDSQVQSNNLSNFGFLNPQWLTTYK